MGGIQNVLTLVYRSGTSVQLQRTLQWRSSHFATISQEGNLLLSRNDFGLEISFLLYNEREEKGTVDGDSSSIDVPLEACEFLPCFSSLRTLIWHRPKHPQERSCSHRKDRGCLPPTYGLFPFPICLGKFNFIKILSYNLQIQKKV